MQHRRLVALFDCAIVLRTQPRSRKLQPELTQHVADVLRDRHLAHERAHGIALTRLTRVVISGLTSGCCRAVFTCTHTALSRSVVGWRAVL